MKTSYTSNWTISQTSCISIFAVQVYEILSVWVNALNLISSLHRFPVLSLSSKRTWSKAKTSSKNPTDNSPSTPTRATRKASGGGSKKLQQLLGASESDIDLLLLRPVEISPPQVQRVRNNFDETLLLTNFGEGSNGGQNATAHARLSGHETRSTSNASVAPKIAWIFTAVLTLAETEDHCNNVIVWLRNIALYCTELCTSGRHF